MQEQQEGESLLNRIHHYRDDHVVGNTTSTNTHQQRANENLTSENNHEQVDNNDSEEVSLHVEHFTEAHPINTGAEEEISHDEQQYSNPQSGGVRKGLFGRRAWDDQVYQQRAAERLEREKGGVDTDEKEKLYKLVPSLYRENLFKLVNQDC
ncbi:hypothetical protein C9374_005999 [Naegleria lovaniensis]|uniref:Uncharacterized protein n=1 Tax=Naegleria lovaniensis TaxID=51637 RepID=A0AA88GPD8_NAELO|nr:uncharacterized protein C9374_005999 [Naegleria lovaniensis]KAG2381615.1 hypothetical protein C9374_005999 [Naegleria lovaniensis]